MLYYLELLEQTLLTPGYLRAADTGTSGRKHRQQAACRQIEDLLCTYRESLVGSVWVPVRAVRVMGWDVMGSAL